MIEVHENLYVGNQVDFEELVSQHPDWAVVHACKEPYHRRMVGYTARALPKEHSEYLFARRGFRLALNMIDGDDPRYTQPLLVDTALDFLQEHLKDGRKTLIHCNQGCSRSPSLALLYLVQQNKLPNQSLQQAEKEFLALYPAYNPMRGIRGYIEANWDKYAISSP